ncbi:MAG: SIS domain-containing protein [Erysipelothrix sp.]|nr:SIS domain-containing protein [Erysipelothrix sp.]
MKDTLITDYFVNTNAIVKKAVEASQADIMQLAHAISEVMIDEGVIQLYGVNHDIALSMELGFRAGGLVQYHIIDNRHLSLREIVSLEETLAPDYLQREDIAQMMFDMYNIEANDAFLIYVSTEVVTSTLKLAQIAKEKGHKVFIITNKHAIEATDLENAQSLYELADLIVDLNIGYPDLFFKVNDVAVSQVSNLVANMFAQALTMEIYTIMKDQGHEPAVLWSMNVPGADSHNRELTSKYDGRWNS